MQSLRLRVIHGGARVEAAGRRQLVVRLSCHSFTPMLDGEVRDADVGLLAPC
ncbi:MAG TPA: hypothetical protein VML57_17235 [Burkholderiales bacterium]|nr:hypothetical protein [Burkholderiales bacterium]